MKKIIFILLTLTAFFIVGCNDPDIVGPNGNNNNNNNNGTPTGYSNVVSNYGWEHQWSKPIFIEKKVLNNGNVQLFYKICLNAACFDPTGLPLSDFSIPRVRKNGDVVYWNVEGEASFEKQGFIGGYLYFYIISSPNQNLKFNISVRAIFDSSTEIVFDPGEWFSVIPEDDYINNMVEITT